MAVAADHTNTQWGDERAQARGKPRQSQSDGARRPTRTGDKLRGLCLTALVLFSVVASTVAVSGGAAAAANVSIDESVMYPTDGDDSRIELALNGSVSNGLDGNDELEIYVDGRDVSGTLFDSVVEDGSSGRVEIALDRRIPPNRNLTVTLTDFGGGSVTAKDITVASRTLTVDSDERSYPNVFGGEVIAIQDTDAGPDTDIEFAEESENLLLLESYDDNSQVYAFDTSDLDTGQKYDITVGSDTAGFYLGTLDLAVEADETNVTEQDDIVASVTTIRGGASAEATLLDSDDEAVDSVVRELDGSEPVEFNFGNHTATDAPYTVEVTENESGITASSETVYVTDSSNGDVSFEEKFVSEQRGDVASVTYHLSGTSEGVVVIGDENENNYAIEGQITDEDGDGTVTVEFNSYLAGVPNSGNASISASDVLSVTGDDEITDVRERGSFERATLTDEALDVGAYTVSATAGTADSDTPDIVGALQLEKRSAEGVRSWVAPQDADVTDGDIGIYDRIGANLTQATEIADGDIAVHQVTTSGIEGVLDYRTDVAGASNTTAAFLQSTGTFTLSVDRTNVPRNTDEDALRLNNSNVAVVTDAENDTYFIAVELAAASYENGSPVRDGDEDDELSTTFSLTDRADLNDTDVSVDYTVTDREAEISTTDELLTVEAVSGQTISGTTTIAPGSEIELLLESRSRDSPFIRRPAATVATNGTFAVTADMSESVAGVNFSAELFDVDGDRFDADEDGRIVPAATADNITGTQSGNGSESGAIDRAPGELRTESMTETSTGVSATTSRDESTEESPTGRQSETGTTPASGPGFTAGIALLAVGAAALLSVRRHH